MGNSPLPHANALAAGVLITLAACVPRSTVPAAKNDAAVIEVPFFANRTDQCGPAALASVLNYWGKPVTPERLKSDIYLPKLRGTLPMDMRPALTKHGLGGRVIAGSFEDVRAELRAGRPVIAYMNFGTRARPIGHFLVVTGFDEARRGLYVHSGAARNKFASYRRFDRGWRGTDHWMLIAGPEIKIPGTAGARRTPQVDATFSVHDHFQLGMIYEKQKLTDQAIAQYKQAAAKNKKFTPAWMALGNLAFEQKDYAVAEKYYRRVLRIDPAHGGANNNLAMVYLAEGRNLKNAEKLAMKAASTDYRPYAEDTLEQLRQKK